MTALKLALLYHVAEYPSSLTVSREALARALALTGWLQQQVEWLLRDGLAFTRAEKQRQRVLAIIRRKPGIQHSPLLKASHLSAREFREVVERVAHDASVPLNVRWSVVSEGPVWDEFKDYALGTERFILVHPGKPLRFSQKSSNPPKSGVGTIEIADPESGRLLSRSLASSLGPSSGVIPER